MVEKENAVASANASGKSTSSDSMSVNDSNCITSLEVMQLMIAVLTHNTDPFNRSNYDFQYDAWTFQTYEISPGKYDFIDEPKTAVRLWKKASILAAKNFNHVDIERYEAMTRTEIRELIRMVKADTEKVSDHA